MKPAAPFDERRLVGVLLALTVVSGVVDAVSFLALGQVFTANITGNVVLLGFAAVGAPSFSMPRSGVALACFFAGALFGGRAAAAFAGTARGRWLAATFGAEAVLLLAASVPAWGAGDLVAHPTRLYAAIVLLSATMGLRNATVRRIGMLDLTTTVLTLTLADLGSRLGGDRHNHRWKRALASAACMFGGAAAGALLLRHSVGLPLAAAAVCTGTCAAAVRRM